MFAKRIGPDPHANGAHCAGCQCCPDIWELDNGAFAVIGADITSAAGMLPPSAGCGPNERIVRIPRATLVRAKADIPDHLVALGVIPSPAQKDHWRLKSK